MKPFMTIDDLNAVYCKMKYWPHDGTESDINIIYDFINSPDFSLGMPDEIHNCSNFMLNGVYTKSFYIMFHYNYNSTPGDMSYITISNNTLHFLKFSTTVPDRVFIEFLFSHMWNIKNIYKQICNNTDIEYRFFVEYLEMFVEFIDKYGSDLNIGEYINDNRILNCGYKLFKLNPDILYSEHNVNLFKLRIISDL